MQTVTKWLCMGLACLAVMSLTAHGQAKEGLQTTVVTEVHWVTDGLILKLATGHMVKIGKEDKARAKQLTWTPYETEIRLQSPPTFHGWSIINLTYVKAHLYDAKKAYFNISLLGKN